MDLCNNIRYQQSLDFIIKNNPFLKELNGKEILVSGASGMIGSALIDVIMRYNENLIKSERCRITAIVRNKQAAIERFSQWMNSSEFSLISHDISIPFLLKSVPDFFVHAASTTHPLAYSTEPINTILSNILGTENILKHACKNNNSKFILLSTVEIYGENRGDTEYFTENYCGYINCNTLRAGYPEAKRASEALCQAYIAQYDIDAKIIRLPRCYGPTMRLSDTKAISQFIKKGVNREDIILKSEGNQLYSYAHVVDVVMGIFFVLFKGIKGEAYNLADKDSDITLKELANMIAKYSGTRVIYQLPNEIERKGYSTATKAILRADKINDLGWKNAYNIENGVYETIDILRECLQN